MTFSKKKILYISYDGMTDPLGRSQIIPYLIGLSKKGYSFTILSCEKEEPFRQRKEIIGALLKQYDIKWVPVKFTSSPPVLSKMYDVYRLRKKAFQLYKENRFDMIHCRSYIAAGIGMDLKRRFGTKFFFDMRGFGPMKKETVVPGKKAVFFSDKYINIIKKRKRNL